MEFKKFGENMAKNKIVIFISFLFLTFNTGNTYEIEELIKLYSYLNFAACFFVKADSFCCFVGDHFGSSHPCILESRI